MKHIKDFQKYNEGWKEMALAASTLIGSPSQGSVGRPQEPKEISSVSSRMEKDDLNIIIGFLRETSIEESSVYKSVIQKLIDMRNGKSVDLSEEESETIRDLMNRIDYKQKKARQDINMEHQIERWKGLGEITDYRLEGDEVIFITKSLKFPPRKKENEPLF
jgi:replicative superfamily II helicase